MSLWLIHYAVMWIYHCKYDFKSYSWNSNETILLPYYVDFDSASDFQVFILSLKLNQIKRGKYLQYT